jgi:phosphomethylpyrimidine synthase
VHIDLAAGLAPLRARWIEERGDTEALAALSSDFGRAREHDPRLASVRFPGRALPRRARAGANVTQMHYARRGIVTPEMEFVAIRENQRIEAMRDTGLLSQHAGQSFGRRSRAASRRSSCATKSRAAARSCRTTSTTRKASR